MRHATSTATHSPAARCGASWAMLTLDRRLRPASPASTEGKQTVFGPDFFERLSQRMYYDLDGNPITQDQWSVLRRGAGSAHDARDHFGFYHVPTVLTGIDTTAPLDNDHGHTPLIYETMVFVERLDPDGVLSEDDRLDCTEQFAELHATREAALAEGQHVPIIADIQGPKLRIGQMPKEGVTLFENATFTITRRLVPGSERCVHSPYEYLTDDVRPGSKILLADGTIELDVQRIEGEDVDCRVIVGGRLYSNKGLNIPNHRLTVETITEKDRRDLAYLARTDVDIVALSFHVDYWDYIGWKDPYAKREFSLRQRKLTQLQRLAFVYPQQQM
jgi:hypothetical protein